MKIKLSSIRSDETLSVTVEGDTLVVNGQAFDFSPVGDGDTLPRGAIKSDWFDGDVERIDGQLIVTLLLPIPSNYSPEQAFPADLINVPNGPVTFPAPLPDAPTTLSSEEQA
ncbi:hypothetical protein BI292_06170 [Pseudomonas sp. 43NM1]|uniref:hypothetical protein n=1 Tax=Pseudomonas sp. 43NM1 TaxID=1904755 RepID=UPI000C34F279|nr:hypothetical protein [Pseudomonas sp. 43NM1]PKH12592.1 hypothetical protein BI292_06170 [Pseudomonas sp. 43NM1]